MSALLWIILTSAGALLGAEVLAWCGPVQRFLLWHAAEALPQQHRKRYLEEWTAELEAQPDGPLSRSAFAISLFLRRSRMARQLSGQTLIQNWVRRLHIIPSRRPSRTEVAAETLDRLADRLIRRMVAHEFACVTLVAASMFLLWHGPGSSAGTIAVIAAGLTAVRWAWLRPGRVLPVLSTETSAEPDRASASRQMSRLADQTIWVLQLPTLTGLAASFVTEGWLPVMLGSLIMIGSMIFLGPSKTRITMWRSAMESYGGKTGL